MSAQPIRPRIIDPNMLPGDKNQHVATDTSVAESHQDFANNDVGEPRGLFTTMYENKMLVIIIILVILIIGMLAYVVLRKKEPEEFTGENEDTHASNVVDKKGAAQKPQQQMPQQAAHSQMMQQAAQQQALQQQAAQQQILLQQQQAQQLQMQQQAAQRAAQKQQPAPNVTSHNDVVSKYSKDELRQMMEDVGKPADDSQAAGRPSEPPPDTDISDYMREAAYADAEKDSKDESFDSAAVSVIDKQESVSDEVSQICGALTQGGTYCKRKGVIAGRCRTHVGI